jgi:hypothetical protein
MELVLALVSLGQGFTYEGPNRLLLNLPTRSKTDTSVAALRAISEEPKDILILTTRPPLNDEKGKSKPLCPTGTELETLIFDALKAKCLRHCARDKIELNDKVSSKFSGVNKGRSLISFTTNIKSPRIGSGLYQAIGGHSIDPANSKDLMKTAGYIIYLPLTGSLPSLLLIFGTSGSTTLALSYLLSKHKTILERAIQSPSFTMVEIQTQPIKDVSLAYESLENWDMYEIAYCKL